MEEEEGSLAEAPKGAGEGVDRREVLRKAARLGGALVWAVPLVQSVDIRAAAASAGSPPPGGDPPGGNEPPGGTEPPGGNGPPGGGGAPQPVGTLEIRSLSARPKPFHLKTDHTLQVSFYVTAAATVRVTILRNGHAVRRGAASVLQDAGWAGYRWDGRNRTKKVPPGRYSIVAHAVGSDGTAVETSINVNVKR